MMECLGELEQERTRYGINEALAWNLETETHSFSRDSVRYIQENIGNTDPKANLAFHKVLDFLHTHAVTVQGPLFSEKFDDEYPYKQNTFFLSFCVLVKKEIENSRNYLVKKHLQDILETWQGSGSKKAGVLDGVPGGRSDETIYSFAHIRESYENRLKTGVREGYPIVNPVLPLAPGYYGYYTGGSLKKIFAVRDSEEANTEEKYIAQNNPQDDYIYEEINEFNLKALGLGYQHPSSGLKLLQNIWDFEKELKDGGRTFYYDISLITNKGLHPIIIGDVLTRNQQYRDKIEGKENTATAVSEQEFMRHLYPAGELSEERLYHYKNLSRLHMRKKIEDDFGLDLSEYDLWTQRVFLEFLETRDIGNVEKLQAFVKDFGGVGLKTFLSLEYGKELGDDIIALGEKLPKEEATKIFAKYGELVDAASEAEASLREHFPEFKLTPELVVGVRDSLLRRGRDMLVAFATEVQMSEKVGYEIAIPHLERELALLRGGAALFAAGFKELSQRGEKMNLAEIKGGIGFEQEVLAESFSEADRERMRELYRINYDEYPEFQKMCVEKLNEVLTRNDSTFYVLRYGGVIEGFYRLGVTGRDTAYFGAFNMNPKYAGSGIGEALMQQSLDVKAKDFVIEANCIADKSIAANYIERGFIGTHTKQVHEPHLMYITRHDAQKSTFPTKALAAEEIIRTCGTETSYVCKKVPIDSVTQVDLALLDERSEEGTRHVLTRYIRDKKSKCAYLVFEKTTDLAIENFSRPETPYRV